jgi:hypothetical protein
MWKDSTLINSKPSINKRFIVFYYNRVEWFNNYQDSYQTIQMIYKRLVILLLKGNFEQLQFSRKNEGKNLLNFLHQFYK